MLPMFHCHRKVNIPRHVERASVDPMPDVASYEGHEGRWRITEKIMLRKTSLFAEASNGSLGLV